MGFSEFKPRTVGKYTLLRELGRGGMGVVYLAEDAHLRRLVALKVLSPALASDEGFQERFRNEARLVSALMHQNIVYVNSLDLVDERLVIDMEYVDGRSVADRQQDSVISVTWTLEMLRQIFEGLAACHALGVVHRDLKPANVLVASDGRTKIADFGIATALATAVNQDIGRRATTGGLFGTPQYVAPEAWDGAEATVKWDLYAAGVMLHELLSGRSVIASMSPLQIARSLALGIQPLDTEAIGGVSPALRDLVRQLTAIEPTARPAGILEAQRLLTAVPEFERVKEVEVSTVPLPARATPATHTASKRLRRTRLAAIGALALLAGIVVVALALWQLVGRTREAEVITGGGHVPVQHAELTGLPDAEMLTHSWRAEPEIFEGFYSLRATNSVQEESLTLLVENRNGVRAFLAVSDLSIQTGILTTEGAGAFTLSGDWGSYGTPHGTAIGYGTLAGSGVWMDGKKALVLTASYHNVRDNSEQTVTYAGERAASVYSDTRFYLELEAAPGVLPLLVNDLAPRGLPWASAVLGKLPALAGQRLNVPFVEAATKVQIDGLLEEPYWNQKFYDDTGRIGEVQGRSSLRPGTILGRYSVEGITLGFRAAAPSGGELVLEAALIAEWDCPTAESTVFQLRAQPGGPLDTSRKRGAQTMEWSPHAEYAATRDGDQWNAELFLPWPAFGRSPKSLEPLRMNVSLVLIQGDGEDQVVHEWGYPAVEAAEHGVWVEFYEP